MIIGSLLFGMDQQVADYVASRIPHMLGARFGAGTFHAVGVLRADTLVGGVVFHNKRFIPDGQLVDVEMSGAFSGDWCRPSTLRALFKFPFEILNANRMTTITTRKNKQARMIDEGLGFLQEGIHPQAIDGRQDAVSYGMLRKNCLWLDPARRREALEQLRRVRAKWKK